MNNMKKVIGVGTLSILTGIACVGCKWQTSRYY